MKEFREPELEIIELTDDVIATQSGCVGLDCTNDCTWNCTNKCQLGDDLRP